MKIALCDDEPLKIGVIEEQLTAEFYKEDVFDFFSNEEKLLKYIHQLGMRYPVYFISIEMENGNGLSLAKKIRSFDLTALIIFISNDTVAMAQVFEMYAFDYLTWPLDNEKLQATLARAKNYLSTTNTYFYFTFNRKTIVLLMDEIIYVSKSGRISYIHTLDKTYKAYLTMSDVMSKLNRDTFVRIHGSYVLNLNYISKLMNKEVIIKPVVKEEVVPNFSLPISRKYKEEVKNSYALFLACH